MSIWDNPPHTATVYPAVQVDDGYGGTQPGEGTPIELRCVMQPRSSGDPRNEPGYYTETVFEMAARTLPVGAWSRVTWNGDDYTVIGDVRRFSVGRRSAHDLAILHKR